MKIAFLDYVFMFDPAETWSSLYEFEGALAKYFEERGMEAVIMKTVEGQPSGRRILYIKKKPTMNLTPEPPGRPKTPQGKIKDLAKHKPKAPEKKFGERKLNTSKIFNKVKHG